MNHHLKKILFVINKFYNKLRLTDDPCEYSQLVVITQYNEMKIYKNVNFGIPDGDS